MTQEIGDNMQTSCPSNLQVNLGSSPEKDSRST